MAGNSIKTIHSLYHVRIAESTPQAYDYNYGFMYFYHQEYCVVSRGIGETFDPPAWIIA